MWLVEIPTPLLDPGAGRRKRRGNSAVLGLANRLDSFWGYSARTHASLLIVVGDQGGFTSAWSGLSSSREPPTTASLFRIVSVEDISRRQHHQRARSVIRFLPLVWRNLGRNKSRTVLTGIAIASAITLFCLLRTMPAGLDAVLSSVAKDNRVSVHNKAGVVYLLPYGYLQKVRSVPGVVEALSWTWFGGTLDEDSGVTFPTFAVDPESVGVVYEDLGIAPAALEDFQRYRDAALVGRQTLREHRWRNGDLITLNSQEFPVEITLRIVGEIPNDRIPLLWFQREYFEQALASKGIAFNQVDLIWARVDDPDRVNEVILAVDEMFRNSDSETASESEKAYFGNYLGRLRGFVTLILIVSGIVTFMIVFIAANTASMSVRERAGELAVMKALGFRWRLLFGMLVLEMAVLSTLAGAAGVLLSLALLHLLHSAAGWNSSLGPLTAFVVSSDVLLQGLSLALLIGIVAGVLPAWGASRRSVAATLRSMF